MLISDIFVKDITRPITGVVLVEQEENDIIWQELDEFIITEELYKHFDKFVESYLQGKDSHIDQELVGSMGIWVSGFFGSGKSHFIKILSYILGNKKVEDPDTGETKIAIDFFKEKIKNPALFGDLQRVARINTQTILFNIDSKANKNEDGSPVLTTFWRVFNEMQGLSTDLKVAEVEYYLQKEGKYDEFYKEFEKAYGSRWIEERDSYYLIKDDVINTLSKVLNRGEESIDEWLENIENNLIVSIEKFSERVKEYLDDIGDDQRIVFLVDEVGQFIGNDTHLMLDIQTLVEDLGRICEGRAWVLVTSQEDIDTILGDRISSKSHDFSKIQGRFKTRLSLSSSNTDEVIKHRLLEKKKEYHDNLSGLYKDNKDIIKNQLSFTSDNPTLKSFSNEEDFINIYPFIPYQFQLVQKIFESIRKVGATGLHLSRGERSMLDAFQSSAKEAIKNNKEIGSLIPLYDFYPCIESFLDTKVKRSIDQANENSGLEIPFDVKMLQTLFLVRYVDTFKPNIDNLVTIFVDEIDTDKIALKKKIEESLQRLEKEKLINKSGDHYIFLTDEEREVEREIANTEINYSDENTLISELIYNDILRGMNKYRYKDYKKDYGFARICDTQIFGREGEEDLTVEFITPLSDQYSEFNDQKCIFHSTDNSDYIVCKLADDTELHKEIRKHIQTEKYIRIKSDASASDTQKRILREKADENRERKSRLKTSLENAIMLSDIYSMGNKLDDVTNSANMPQSIIEKSLDYLIKNTYSKFGYLQLLHDDPIKEIKAILLSDDIGAQSLNLNEGESLAIDLMELMNYVELTQSKNQSVILDNLVKHFSKKPYGWLDFEAVLLVAKLFKLGKFDLVYEGSSISPKEAVAPLTKTHSWKSVKILKRKQHGEADIKNAKDLGRDVFGQLGSDNQDELSRFLKDHLNKWLEKLEKHKVLANTGNYPGLNEIKDCLEVITKLTKIHDPYEFIKSFNDNKDSLLDSSEDIHKIDEFYTKQIPIWNDLNNALTKYNPNKDELNKYPDSEKALKRIEEIENSKEPYGLIKEVKSLISKVEEINIKIVEEKRKATLQDIEKQIEELNKMLDTGKFDDDFKNKLLYPIQQIKNRVQSEESIPSITYNLSEIGTHFQEAIKEISDYTSEKEGTEKVDIENIAPSKYIKKTFLETEQDVEEYVKELKEQLIKTIKEKKKIRIQ